ncbi:hypothetical protein FVD40_10105 [Bacillus subtilis]|nr:hypothetical protein EQI48_07505 [Bacillus subtilis]TXK61598.1 hypothetical protein FVD40_10105 [Bacillus subtilis]
MIKSKCERNNNQRFPFRKPLFLCFHTLDLENTVPSPEALFPFILYTFFKEGWNMFIYSEYVFLLLYEYHLKDSLQASC